jgi:hypothetical protein
MNREEISAVVEKLIDQPLPINPALLDLGVTGMFGTREGLCQE